MKIERRCVLNGVKMHLGLGVSSLLTPSVGTKKADLVDVC